MRKSTLLFMLLLVSATMLHARVAGLKQVPTVSLDLETEPLTSGYYLIKQTNSQKFPNQYLYVSGSNVKLGTTVSTNDATYIWYVNVNDDATFSISNAVGTHFWPLPTTGNISLGTSVQNLKYTTENASLNNSGTNNVAGTGSCLIYSDAVNYEYNGQRTTSYYHCNDGNNLGSWHDTNPGSLLYAQFIPIEISDLIINYTPANTGTRSTSHYVTSIAVTDNETYTLTSAERAQFFVDKTAEKTFTVEAGSEMQITLSRSGSNWVNAYAYIDYDSDGFKAGIAGDNYTPTGDLVSYSFYNTGAGDATGYNSAGTYFPNDQSRNNQNLPAFTAPTEPGTYRMRVKYDWCSIDPAGGNADGNRGATFANLPGTIIDFTLVVADNTPDPLEVVSVSPQTVTKTLSGDITVNFNNEINGTYNATNDKQITLTLPDGSSVNCEFTVNEKVLTVTLPATYTTIGEYTLTIPEGLITDNNGSTVGKTSTITVEPKYYTITVNAGGGGVATVNGVRATGDPVSVVEGSTVILMATPDEMYRFGAWKGGTSNTLWSEHTWEFTATQNLDCYAEFESLLADYKIATGTDATGVLSNTTTSSTWKDLFTYTTTVTNPAGLTFKAGGGKNNMTTYDGGIVIARGIDVTSCTYTLSVPAPYKIKSYSFDVQSASNSNTITPVNGTGNAITTNTTGTTHFSVTDVNSTTAQFTVSSASSDNTYNQNQNCTNFVVQVYIDYDEAIAMVSSWNGVGYPSEEACNAYIEAMESKVLQKDYKSVEDALLASDIQMPEDGKAYYIKAKYNDGTYRYIYRTDAGKLQVNPTDNAKPADYAGIFVFRSLGSDKYALAHNSGEYMVYYADGKTGADGNNDGFAPTYELGTQDAEITFIPGGSVSATNPSTVDERTEFMGGFAMQAYNNSDGGLYYMMAGNPDFHNSSANSVYYQDGNRSSIFCLEEATYANQPTLNSIGGSTLITNFEQEALATFSAPFPTVLPEGVTAFYAKRDDCNSEVISLTAYEGEALPANQGFILAGDAGAITMVPAAGEATVDISGENVMGHSAGAAKELSENSGYILAGGSQGPGFYATAEGTLAMNKAYLALSGTDLTGMRSVVIRFPGLTDIDRVTVDGIGLDDAVIYDLSGRRVENPSRGIYIVNGKKLYVK